MLAVIGANLTEPVWAPPAEAKASKNPPFPAHASPIPADKVARVSWQLPNIMDHADAPRIDRVEASNVHEYVSVYSAELDHLHLLDPASRLKITSVDEILRRTYDVVRGMCTVEEAFNLPRKTAWSWTSSDGVVEYRSRQFIGRLETLHGAGKQLASDAREAFDKITSPATLKEWAKPGGTGWWIGFNPDQPDAVVPYTQRCGAMEVLIGAGSRIEQTLGWGGIHTEVHRVVTAINTLYPGSELRMSEIMDYLAVVESLGDDEAIGDLTTLLRDHYRARVIARDLVKKARVATNPFRFRAAILACTTVEGITDVARDLEKFLVAEAGRAPGTELSDFVSRRVLDGPDTDPGFARLYIENRLPEKLYHGETGAQLARTFVAAMSRAVTIRQTNRLLGQIGAVTTAPLNEIVVHDFKTGTLEAVRQLREMGRYEDAVRVMADREVARLSKIDTRLTEGSQGIPFARPKPESFDVETARHTVLQILDRRDSPASVAEIIDFAATPLLRHRLDSSVAEFYWDQIAQRLETAWRAA